MASLKTSRQKLLQRAKFVRTLICGFGVAACVAALVNVQLVKGSEYREKAAQNQLRDSVVAARRGMIYDANGESLTESSNVQKVYVDGRAFRGYEEAREPVVSALAKIFDLDEKELMEKCSDTDSGYILIKRRVENAKIQELLKFTGTYYERADASGNLHRIYYSDFIGTEPDVKRYYSKPYLASGVLGFTGDDGDGIEGLEAKYDSVLAGVPGRIITAKTGTYAANMPIEYKNVYDPQQGNSIVLTIDEYIQSYLENALQDAYVDTECDSVLAIVMDVNTGAVLGMGSRGAGYYDLSDPYKIADERVAQELETIEDEEEYRQARAAARNRQWRNICITDAYEPGSVFKVFTASALLEEGLVSMDETYTCYGSVQIAGSLYNCHRHSGHGTQDITHALMNSCNPFFITRGLRLGIDGFNKYVEAFGFLERTGIDLPGEANSIYFSIDDMIQANVASAAFGQSFQVTPIQMVTAISCVANGGKLMQPYVVARQLDVDGNVIAETKPVVKRQVISAETSEKMRGMMEAVVREGTGKNAYVSGYRIAGKTGTSEHLGTSKYWASFACFAPANDPQIAMILVIDNPQGAHGGGAVAAPVAAGILENVLQYLNVEPQYTEDELEQMEVVAKDVIGLPVGDAMQKLREDGFTVKVKGDGETVISQLPFGGQSVPKKGAIILYTSEESKSEMLEMPDLTGLSINDATNRALAEGINIRIAGNSLLGSELQAYSQSVEPGEMIPFGTTVTVHFKSNFDVSDADE
ncbi:MAG: PASTA domain-containing protein [Clostridia bacterium]|nr:PASTA domain-containing protein [Clostridia bacterium]